MSKLNHALLAAPDGPVLGQRRRWTPGRIMALVALVAIFCGSYVALLTHMTRWEARRTEMSHQRDVTMTIVSETFNELSVANPHEAEIPHAFPTSTKTAEWSISARKFDHGKENTFGPDRIKISGGNGEYTLKPIVIEIYDPLVEIPLLERLRRAYEARLWKYEIVPPPADPAKASWWYGLINLPRSVSATLR